MTSTWPQAPPSAEDRAAYGDATPHSFWLDDLPARESHAALDGDAETDLCIVGGGYTGVHRDPISNSQAPEFEIDKLGPGEKRTFTITLSGKGESVGIPRGIVRWEKPRVGTGATDLIGITVPY